MFTAPRNATRNAPSATAAAQHRAARPGYGVPVGTRAAMAVLAAALLAGCSACGDDARGGREETTAGGRRRGSTTSSTATPSWSRLDGREATVRMLGLDAPESSDTRYGRPDCGGAEGRGFLRGRLAQDDEVTLVADDSQGDRDRYDRLLRYVEHDGDDLARAVIAAGWAAVYRTREPFARQGAYRAAAAAARAARRGVWSACGGDFHRPAG